MLGSHGCSEILSLDKSCATRRRITEKEADTQCRQKIYPEIRYCKVLYVIYSKVKLLQNTDSTHYIKIKVGKSPLNWNYILIADFYWNIWNSKIMKHVCIIFHSDE
uniref:Uncharacterized protein n=1 Tax=Bombyx mori TaxID=7091 RepID=A0A8R2QZF7_BOMMO|nr:uncharacterized protein LOC101740818 isoform X2 [Bombyx mori]